MKAYRIHEYGSPEQLKLENVPAPSAGPGQVVVRNRATSFNPIDPTRASGSMRQIFPLKFPWIPGGDVSGTVESLGKGVTTFTVGDEVFGYTPEGGAYADLIAVDANKLARKPEALSNEEAAAVALVGQTATQACRAAHLTSGQTVLIHGAAGGVGSIAVQLARKDGVKVIATALAAQETKLKELGASKVIDYTSTRFENEVTKVDAVLDLVGGETQQRSFGVIKPGGYLVATNQPPDPNQSKKFGIHGVMLQTTPSAENEEQLAKSILADGVRPVIAETLSLSEAARVWAKRLSDGHPVGKTVFQIT